MCRRRLTGGAHELGVLMIRNGGAANSKGGKHDLMQRVFIRGWGDGIAGIAAHPKASGGYRDPVIVVYRWQSNLPCPLVFTFGYSASKCADRSDDWSSV